MRHHLDHHPAVQVRVGRSCSGMSCRRPSVGDEYSAVTLVDEIAWKSVCIKFESFIPCEKVASSLILQKGC